MRNKEEILIDLLLTLSEICEEYNIKYTVAGEFALSLLYKNIPPEKFNRVVVLMTYGDIKKIIDIIDKNEKYNGVGMEHLLNNSHLSTYNYHFFDKDTTLLSIRRGENIINKCVFITIIEIEKGICPDKRRRYNNVIKYCNSRKWVKAHKARYIRSKVWKFRKKIKGSRQFINELVGERHQLLGIESWDCMVNESSVSIKKATVPPQKLIDISEVRYRGHNIKIADYVTHREFIGVGFPAYSKSIGREIVMDRGELPTGDLEMNTILRHYEDAKRYARIYNKQYVKTKKDRDCIQKVYDTFLMTLTVKAIEEYFCEDRMEILNKELDNENFILVEKELDKYINAKEYYLRRDILFYEVREVEDMITRKEERKEAFKEKHKNLITC